MTEALFLETARFEESLSDQRDRRLNVSGVLKISGVSRSGYLSWKKRLPSDQAHRKAAMKQRILAIYEESHQNYGAPKITECLRREGQKIAEKTVGNYMREPGIQAQYIKPYTVTTIDSDFDSRLKNILDENFNPSRPDAVWCSDITYIWTFAGFVYLTSIMDLYSWKIIAWVLSDSLEAKYVIEAVEKAKRTRSVDKQLVMHSDRAYRLVFQYIETFYNTVRIHSHCGYRLPNEYEKEYKRKLEQMEQRAE